MDSPATTLMLSDRVVRTLHLEPTNVCQASCALCARETDSGFDKNQRVHLDMWKIFQVFDAARIAQLDKMFMCGNYGDPAAGRYSLNIYRTFRRLNPSIVLGMNTNGGIRTAEWWQELATIMNQHRDYVVFSIDGLEDTNHVYRRGVEWQQVISNAKAYIDAGGSAHWDMLVYQHNQHQVKACEQLAHDMGFSWFRAKVSRRGFTQTLQAPQGWTLPVNHVGRIDCQALKEQSLYINAHGHASPCCWLDQDPVDANTVQTSWATNQPHPICSQTCSVQSQGSTQFEGQWQREVEFHV